MNFNNIFEELLLELSGKEIYQKYYSKIPYETFLDIVMADPKTNIDGTGEPWEYLDGWAYRNTASPSTVFNSLEWDYSGINALDSETTNATATIPFPIGTYAASVLSVVKNEIEGFNLYPNPVSNGLFQISSNSKKNKK